MICLYNDNAALPVNDRGRSRMQPACAKRFDKAGARLLRGARGKGNAALVRDSIERLGPIFACQRRNLALPCARECAFETCMLLRIFQEQVLHF